MTSGKRGGVKSLAGAIRKHNRGSVAKKLKAPPQSLYTVIDGVVPKGSRYAVKSSSVLSSSRFDNAAVWGYMLVFHDWFRARTVAEVYFEDVMGFNVFRALLRLRATKHEVYYRNPDSRFPLIWIHDNHRSYRG